MSRSWSISFCQTEYPLRHLRRVQGILRLAKCHPITAEALDHACQQALCFNKTRLAYIKDCALYFVAHGQRPTLSVPQRKPDTVHLYQLAAQTENRGGAFMKIASFDLDTDSGDKKRPPYFVYTQRYGVDPYLTYPPKRLCCQEV